MEGTANTRPTPEPQQPLACLDKGQSTPFSREWITITKQERIDLRHRASYWEAQHGRVKTQVEALKQEIILKDAKIKDLQNRLFGKKSEKNRPLKSEKGAKPTPPRSAIAANSQAVGDMAAPDVRISPSFMTRSTCRMPRNTVPPVVYPICATRRWTSTAMWSRSR